MTAYILGLLPRIMNKPNFYLLAYNSMSNSMSTLKKVLILAGGIILSIAAGIK